MNRGSPARSLAESALLAAITVLLMFLGAFLPVAGFFVVVMWPLPVMLVILRHGLRYGLMTVAVTVVLSTVFLGIIQAVLAGLTIVGLIGLVYGVGLLRRWSGPTLVGTGTGVIAVSFLITLSLAGPLMGIDLITQIQSTAVQSAEILAESYAGAGVASPEELAAELESAVAMMDTVFPAMIMMSAFLYSLWTFAATRLILPRLGYTVPHLPAFDRWRAPIWLAVVLLGSYGMLFISAEGVRTYPVILAQNALFVANGAYLVFGAALLYFVVKRLIQSPLASGLITAVVTINPIGVSFLPLVAILDSGLDIRRFFDRRNSREHTRDTGHGNEEDSK